MTQQQSFETNLRELQPVRWLAPALRALQVGVDKRVVPSRLVAGCSAKAHLYNAALSDQICGRSVKRQPGRTSLTCHTNVT